MGNLEEKLRSIKKALEDRGCKRHTALLATQPRTVWTYLSILSNERWQNEVDEAFGKTIADEIRDLAPQVPGFSLYFPITSRSYAQPPLHISVEKFKQENMFEQYEMVTAMKMEVYAANAVVYAEAGKIFAESPEMLDNAYKETVYGTEEGFRQLVKMRLRLVKKHIQEIGISPMITYLKE